MGTEEEEEKRPEEREEGEEAKKEAVRGEEAGGEEEEGEETISDHSKSWMWGGRGEGGGVSGMRTTTRRWGRSEREERRLCGVEEGREMVRGKKERERVKRGREK